MAEKRSDNSFIKQGSSLALAGIITRIIGLIYKIPLTRTIGENGIANYNGAYEVYNIALIVSVYGIPVAVSKLISMKDSKGEFVNSKRIFKYSLMVSSIVGFVVAAFLFIFAEGLARNIDMPNAAIPLRFLAPTIFVFSIMGVIRGFFQGKKNMMPTSFSQIIEQIINAVCSVVAALILMTLAAGSDHVFAWGAAGGTFGTFAGACAGLVFLVLVYKKNAVKYNSLEKLDDTGIVDKGSDIVKLIILTTIPIILSQTIYQLSGIIDLKLFHNIMAGKQYDIDTREKLWYSYSNSYKWLYNVPVAVASAFGVTIVPMLSGLYSNGLFDQVKEKIASSIKINMLIAIPSAAGLGFLARPIILLIFNKPDDIEGPRLMTFGCLAVIVFALSTFTNGVLQGLNHLRTPVIHSAISLVIHIPLVIFLVDYQGLSVTGMVIGNITYALVICILNWIKIGKILNYRQEILNTFIKPAIAAVIMGAAARLVYNLVSGSLGGNTIPAILAIGVAVVIYVILIILFRTMTEKELLEMPGGRRIVRFLKSKHLLK